MKRLLILLFVLSYSICSAADYVLVVASPTIGDGKTRETAFRAAFISDYACGVEDITGLSGWIRDPDVFLIKAYCSEELTDIIIRDGSYPVISSRLTSDPIGVQPKETKATLDKLVTDLKALGITDAHLSATALADTSKADVTAVDISTQLKAEMAKFPAKEAAK